MVQQQPFLAHVSTVRLTSTLEDIQRQRLSYPFNDKYTDYSRFPTVFETYFQRTACTLITHSIADLCRPRAKRVHGIDTAIPTPCVKCSGKIHQTISDHVREGAFTFFFPITKDGQDVLELWASVIGCAPSRIRAKIESCINRELTDRKCTMVAA